MADGIINRPVSHRPSLDYSGPEPTLSGRFGGLFVVGDGLVAAAQLMKAALRLV